MFIHCKQAALLLSLAQDQPLFALQRVQLRIHLSLCGNCREWQRQLQSLRQLAKDAVL
jgi:predicted anti-sigma-YlaC factor YlaD